MSKKKKQTLEKLLEEALVPEDEQPYGIPGNWVWARMGAVTEIIRGLSYKKHQVAASDAPDNLLVLRGGNIQNGVVVNQDDNVYVNKEIVRENLLLKKGDIIIVSSTGSSKLIGKAASIKKEFVGETYGAFLTNIRSRYGLDNRYIGLYFQSSFYRNMIASLAKGSNINNIKNQHLEDLCLAIPPLTEQKRIIYKVESLLSKIEEAKQSIEEAKESFELRKAAIINMIIESEIIKSSSEDKITKKISEVFTIFGGGTPRKSNPAYWDGNIPWFSAKDMKSTFLINSTDFITEEGLKNSSAKLAQKGSIVMVTRSGILQRTLPIGIMMSEGTVNQDLKVFDSGNEYLNQYFMWYVQGNEKMLLNEYSKSGTTVNSIEFNRFKNHELVILPDFKLKHIVETIEKAIRKEKQSNDILNMEKSIELLKQSILSKAFKGELGTSDPTDEHAVELLKEVLQEKIK